MEIRIKIDRAHDGTRCSPGASFVIGHALAVDGDYTAHRPL
ncbi:MAG: hypothetical protein ACRD1G_15745 [Acidimicrobiales bacterium]